MVKATIVPTNIDVHLVVPASYIGKKVEVLLYAVEEVVESSDNGLKLDYLFGKLSRETGADILQQAEISRNEW